MRTGQRRRDILRLLHLTGYVEAKDLAVTLSADSSTIRRDLEALAQAGHLHRTHGGARIRTQVDAVDVPYDTREREHQPAKALIAVAATELVRDGDSVILDSGSTTRQFALKLRERRDLTVVTNDLEIGRLVADYPGVHLLVTGGELLPSTYTLFGARAVGFVEDLRVDWTFLGADAIDVDAGITNTNTLEIPLKRAMLAAGRTTVVLADSGKFGHRALGLMATLQEVDQIITDTGLSTEAAASYGSRVRRIPSGIGDSRLSPSAANGVRP